MNQFPAPTLEYFMPVRLRSALRTEFEGTRSNLPLTQNEQNRSSENNNNDPRENRQNGGMKPDHCITLIFDHARCK